MQSLIIHLPASHQRAANVQRLLRDLPSAQVTEAVNGYGPAQIGQVQTKPATLRSPRYPFALRPAEIGVFQSHRRCWQRIVDEGWDFALVAEDDLAVESLGLATALKLISDHASPEMYIRLPVKARETAAHVVARSGDMAFILPKVIGLQCICQVVGQQAARQLLKATEQIDRPVDTLLQMHWVTGQPVHAILPNGNRELAAQMGGSTIQTKTRASGKLTQEIKRAWYRAQVALRPQKP